MSYVPEAIRSAPASLKYALVISDRHDVPASFYLLDTLHIPFLDDPSLFSPDTPIIQTTIYFGDTRAPYMTMYPLFAIHNLFSLSPMSLPLFLTVAAEHMSLLIYLRPSRPARVSLSSGVFMPRQARRAGVRGGRKGHSRESGASVTFYFF